MTLAVREPSLDDVFLAITGRRAKDAAAAANGAAASRGRSARKRESPASEASRSSGIGGLAGPGSREPDPPDAPIRPSLGALGETDLTAQGAGRGGAAAGDALLVGEQNGGFEGPEMPGDLRGRLGAALQAFSAAQSALPAVQAALAAGRAPSRGDFAALANVGSALADIARPLGADPATATLPELKSRLAARERSFGARRALGRLAEATGPQIAAASLAGLSSEAARLAAAPSWSPEDEARAFLLAALVELADVASDNDDDERVVALDAELRNELGPGAVTVVLAAARGRLVLPTDSSVASETSGR